jgi:autotransporter-associated beta strand protein
MRRHRRLFAALTAFVVAGAVAVATPNAGAAQFLAAPVWTGQAGNGNWSSTGNWSTAAAPASGDSVSFPALLVSLATRTTNNDQTGVALASVSIDGDGYTVSGNPIDTTSLTQSGAFTTTIAGITSTLLGATTTVTVAGGTLNSGPVTGGINLVKAGAGVLLLSGATNTYTGTTTVSAGALIVNGNSGSSTHTVTGGVLGGVGTVGQLNVTGGAVSPGQAGPGLLTVNGALSMSAGSSYAVDIAGASPGTSFDVLRASSVTLGGAQLIVSSNFTGALNQTFTIIDNVGAGLVQGQFANLPEGATVTGSGGQTYKISYVGGGGNDVVLTQVGQGGKTAQVLGGPDRIDTAILISKNSFPTTGSAQAVVLARADLFPDALAGAPLAVAKGGPLELTSLSGPSFIDPRTVTEIQRVLTPGKTIFVLGGPSAIADNVVAQLQALGYQVIRLGGTDRFQTAVIIAQNGLNNPTNLFLANGINFPDALSAGPSAAKVQGAILLTNNNVMPAFTQQYLSTRSGAVLFAMGGPAAGAAPQATPIVGADRYATSVMAAQRFFTNPTAVGIASGVAFPDGLTGGAHIGKLGGPLLLTDPNALPGNVQTYLQSIKATITQLFVYGGSTAVATPVVTSINAAVA